MPGYAEELGRDSATETFVALKAHIDNWRWKGVPFYLRTGKRMPERETEIFIQFKDVPHSIFASRGATAQPNKLIIGLQPEESIELRLMAKTPGLDREGIRLREVPLDIGLANAFSEYRRRIAYERLLLDLIEGDPTLFVRRDEVEAQWAWIDGIRAAWAENGMTPQPYAGGQLGPVGGDRADRARRRQLARLANAYCGISTWPPKPKRIAESSFSAKLCSSARAEAREQRGREHVRGHGLFDRRVRRSTPFAASPQPCPEKSRAQDRRASASAVRSSSHEEITLPRRQTSAMSARSRS